MTVNRGFTVWVMCFFSSIILGCGGKKTYSHRDPVSFDLLDVFVSLPEEDSIRASSSMPSLYFTFEVQNNSGHHHHFTFDDWMKTNGDSISFYFSTNCVGSHDPMKVNLAYVTNPDLLIESKAIDTLTFKTDFRELEKYFEECTTTDKRKIMEALKCISVHYRSLKATKAVYESGKKFIPVMYLEQTICLRIDSLNGT